MKATNTIFSFTAVTFFAVAGLFLHLKSVQADVPIQTVCSNGAMQLTYADGSVANAYLNTSGVIPPGPLPPGANRNVDRAVDEWGRINGWQGRGCENCQIPFKFTETAYAQSVYTVADLAEIVKKEGGGGPFCYNAGNSSVFEALSNQECPSRFPGTEFAGFRVDSVHETYMCGVPAPWTDG